MRAQGVARSGLIGRRCRIKACDRSMMMRSFRPVGHEALSRRAVSIGVVGLADIVAEARPKAVNVFQFGIEVDSLGESGDGAV
jgi:hypothetical protein